MGGGECCGLWVSRSGGVEGVGGNSCGAGKLGGVGGGMGVSGDNWMRVFSGS